MHRSSPFAMVVSLFAILKCFAFAYYICNLYVRLQHSGHALPPSGSNTPRMCPRFPFCHLTSQNRLHLLLQSWPIRFYLKELASAATIQLAKTPFASKLPLAIMFTSHYRQGQWCKLLNCSLIPSLCIQGPTTVFYT